MLLLTGSLVGAVSTRFVELGSGYRESSVEAPHAQNANKEKIIIKLRKVLSLRLGVTRDMGFECTSFVGDLEHGRYYTSHLADGGAFS